MHLPFLTADAGGIALQRPTLELPAAPPCGDASSLVLPMGSDPSEPTQRITIAGADVGLAGQLSLEAHR